MPPPQPDAWFAETHALQQRLTIIDTPVDHPAHALQVDLRALIGRSLLREAYNRDMSLYDLLHILRIDRKD